MYYTVSEKRIRKIIKKIFFKKGASGINSPESYEINRFTLHSLRAEMGHARKRMENKNMLKSMEVIVKVFKELHEEYLQKYESYVPYHGYHEFNDLKNLLLHNKKRG